MSYNATENSASRRIATLLDEGSFVEIGGAVTARSTTFNLQEKAAPSDGVITGYGVIDGNLVYVYSQDADVLGGALGEMHAKKIARIYDMAMKMGAPVIGLIDCAGRQCACRRRCLRCSTAERPESPMRWCWGCCWEPSGSAPAAYGRAGYCIQ